ncbi:hypothetical protein FNV43_RR26372 [Rhamnella rubrinervis]|uniref:Uncharacterized protein n=1 Tax=Rhamnella rubrinervis TaxID=2594499 RepID=A0A8K0DMV0_9ROSA|nr:hypothetical protein FNV43_RR26372 [Rhamnella rubrinervis]
MITVNGEGRLEFLVLRLMRKLGPNLAGMKALEWASTLALERNLVPSLWLCESLFTVKAIISEEESYS